MTENNPATVCDWCGKWTRMEFHQSKYICMNCKKPLKDCCDGERADNSIYDLSDEEVYGDVPNIDNIDWDSLPSKTRG